jgi:hypothetical protein
MKTNNKSHRHFDVNPTSAENGLTARSGCQQNQCAADSLDMQAESSIRGGHELDKQGECYENLVGRIEGERL